MARCAEGRLSYESQTVSYSSNCFVGLADVLVFGSCRAAKPTHIVPARDIRLHCRERPSLCLEPDAKGFLYSSNVRPVTRTVATTSVAIPQE